MATRTITPLRGTHDEAGKPVRASGAAGGPHAADLSVVGSGRGGASGGAGEATAGKGRGAGIGATLGTLLGSSAGLMAGIGALPVPGAGPVVAAGWLVAVLTGAGVGAAVDAAVVAAAGGLLRSLAGAGEDEDEDEGNAHVHAEAARRRGTARPARLEEAEPARLEAALAGGGHVDAAPRCAEHRAEGWRQPGPAAPDRTASGVPEERERRVLVHGGAREDADAEVHRSAEAVQQEQAGSSAADALRQGAEATADAARPGGGARTEAVRRVRVHETRAAADAAVRRNAEAVQQGSRPAGGTPRQDTEVAVDATRRGAEAGAKGARRAGNTTDEATRRDVQAVVGSRRRIAQDPAEPVEGVSREAAEAARDTTRDARRMEAAPHGAGEGGPRDLRQGVAGPVEGAAQANLRVARELFRLSDPVPMIELQQRFALEYTDALLRNNAALVRAVRRTADEALRPLEQRIEQQRGPANEKDPRSRPAAE